MEEEANEKCKRLAEEIKTKEAALGAREEMLNETEKIRAMLEEEMTAAKKSSVEAHDRVKKLEATVADLQKK